MILQENEGSLQSPGFPNRVFEARNCNWRIQTLPGSRIKIIFYQFHITNLNVNLYKYIFNSNECKSNYLYVSFSFFLLLKNYYYIIKFFLMTHMTLVIVFTFLI